MAITAKELAKKLNLSESAVSLALNHKPGVSTPTRNRVLEAARACGYDFSRIQESERPPVPNGSIYFVIYRKHGAVVADTPFFSQLSEGIDAECKKCRYYLNVHYLYEEELTAGQPDDWQRAGAKGILLLGTEMSESDLAPFMDSRLPLVLLDNYFEELSVNCVLINNIKGAFTAACYLIRQYRCQPGYLHSSYPINNFEERADGFYKALRKNGMSTALSIVHRLPPSAEGSYTDMKELLAAKEPLARCYFADNDLIAAGAVRAFQEYGYRIPQDIAVVGFDNMPLCTYISPSLTTIHVPKQYMGQVAVRRLHELITMQDASPLKIEVATSLVQRKSG